MLLSSLFCCGVILSTVIGEYPQNEYEYSVRRDWVKQAEEMSINKPELNNDEKIVDQYLQYLKWKEFKATEDTGFRPARPVEQEMTNIMNSEVFKILRPLPKGGIMHSHENHEVSKEQLLRMIYDSDQFQYLHVVRNTSANAWMLDFFYNPPQNDDWVKVQDSGYTFEEILSHQTFMSILDDYAKRYPSDTGERWRQMNVLWIRGSTQLVANIHIKRLYLQALYNQSFNEGVQYIEARKNFGMEEMLYEIDPSGKSNATNGKKYLDNREGELELEITREILTEFKASNPSFVGHRRIIYSTRYINENIQEDMERAINLYNKFPDLIIGYDLVAEEDHGNAHLFYLKDFLWLHENGKSKIPLYLHTAETNWPVDLITAQDDNDPVSTSENIYEALLLGVKRVGHGLALSRHPYVLEALKNQGVAIEVCPVSNQLLGFFPDLRVHPALNYYRSGIPIVLGADDPGTFGYNYFTIDWYEIFMAWGLNLADLKKLVMNSFLYSSMTSQEQADVMETMWKPRWNQYISDVKQKACTTSFTETPYFSRILPTLGARTGPTDVHIYGRNFESSICKEIICKFGNLQSNKVTYVANYHLICQAPDVAYIAKSLDYLPLEGEITVDVSINLGDGTNHNIGNFTYKYEPYTTTVPPTVLPTDAAVCFNFSSFTLIAVLISQILFS